MELHAQVLVARLLMRVDPLDSSYMPAHVVVSAGDALHAMRELRRINVAPTDVQVTLLEELSEVR